MHKYDKTNYSRSELVDTAVYNNLKTELYHSFSDEDISVLKHHGILGMKWGVRRYQNEDGSLTPEGERRYKNVYEHYKKEMQKVNEEISKQETKMYSTKEYEDIRKNVENEFEKKYGPEFYYYVSSSDPETEETWNKYGMDKLQKKYGLDKLYKKYDELDKRQQLPDDSDFEKYGLSEKERDLIEDEYDDDDYYVYGDHN